MAEMACSLTPVDHSDTSQLWKRADSGFLQVSCDEAQAAVRKDAYS